MRGRVIIWDGRCKQIAAPEVWVVHLDFVANFVANFVESGLGRT
jgi:hypothetical protein